MAEKPKHGEFHGKFQVLNFKRSEGSLLFGKPTNNLLLVHVNPCESKVYASYIYIHIRIFIFGADPNPFKIRSFKSTYIAPLGSPNTCMFIKTPSTSSKSPVLNCPCFVCFQWHLLCPLVVQTG